jgi:hypothetical protein
MAEQWSAGEAIGSRQVNNGRQEKLSDVAMVTMIGKRSNQTSLYSPWSAKEAIMRH